VSVTVVDHLLSAALLPVAFVRKGMGTLVTRHSQLVDRGKERCGESDNEEGTHLDSEGGLLVPGPGKGKVLRNRELKGVTHS